MEDRNSLPERGTKKSILCDENSCDYFLRAGLLSHKHVHRNTLFYEYIPRKTFRASFVTMCIGQPIDILGVIKLNIHDNQVAVGRHCCTQCRIYLQVICGFYELFKMSATIEKVFLNCSCENYWFWVWSWV